MTKPLVVIIGAGPAGLTAALELVREGSRRVVVLEHSDGVGGISRTVEYKGNRMDIGGHRFFSKSDWVMNWWREIMPVDQSGEVELTYQGQRRKVIFGGTAHQADKAAGECAEPPRLRVADRLSRIYFLRRYFDYPIKLNLNTLRNLGLRRILRIGVSYAWAMLFPRRPERSLEDFLLNRFGAELYRTFFKDYTEKVWGVPCATISAEWGAQRIKGLSIIEALKHAVNWRRDGAVKTSLIEHFLYPPLGPGQLWQEVARRVVEGGGEIRLGRTVIGLVHERGLIRSVRVSDAHGVYTDVPCDQVISTMPIKDLVAGLMPPAPRSVREVAAALPYRDFITVGLLLTHMRNNPQARTRSGNNMPPDNWIYVQEPEVKVGRLQVFNNWSRDMVADGDTIWLGLEYFCEEGDALWQLSDQEMQKFAVAELEAIGMIDRASVLDGTVIRVPKTYPAYFGAYENFPVVRDWLDALPNLWLVGRNGMHRYNNQDHSMLTAKLAAEAIISGSVDKSPLWAVNVDDDYHEGK